MRTFTDLNGNGWADKSPINELIDPNGNATDLPEAFVDYNENGAWDPTKEPYIDFNQDGVYNAADGKFNGVLCDDITAGRSSAGTCSAAHTLHVRDSQIIVLSSSYANVIINGGATIALPPCNTGAGGVTPLTFNVTVVDANGNNMPAGTTIAFTADNGTITSLASYTLADSTGCRTSFPGCPASVGTGTFGDTSVTMKSNATYTAAAAPNPATCTDTASTGTFTVTVTSPKGLITRVNQTVTD